MTTKILQNCNFDVVDSEVHFDLNKDGKPDFSLDVVAIFDKYLISVECETSNLDQPKRDIAAVQSSLKKIIEMKGYKIIHSSNLKNLTNKKLSKIKEFRHCYAFGKNFNNTMNLKPILAEENMQLWDYETLQYYEKTSKILGYFTMNEILHDFHISIGKGFHKEDAIEVIQGDNPPMYLLGMHPGLLLSMAYVFRRAKKEAAAYQRIINPQRLENLSNFLKTKNLLLANPVIIAFDKEMRDEVKYDHIKKELSFPTSYCSAWIIDGQHRIFAFKNSKYKNWSENKNEEFKLPVVAFRDISETQQNRTFVNINYYQKRIDPILFCDLAAAVKDLKYELTWPSLLTIELNKAGPWKGMIKTSEIHGNRPISIAAFARNVLLSRLLGYDEKNHKYIGPLYNYAPFDIKQPFESVQNANFFNKQVKLLNHFFEAIKKHTTNKNPAKDKWHNFKKYGLTKATCVNALLLVLKSMMDELTKMDIDLYDYLLPIRKMNFNNKYILKYGRGFGGYEPIANELIDKINAYKKTNFKKF